MGFRGMEGLEGVAHHCRGVEDGLSLKASRGPRDAAHDQAAVDAGGPAMVFGAVRGSRGVCIYITLYFIIIILLL
jgi:hypothetical protein